jgi:hypothetical protein
MRIRSIKPEFWRSDDIAALDPWTRLLFIGLWSYVDDHGRGRDNVQLIVADLFALDDVRESFANVSRGLSQLSEAGLIHRYEVSGKRYLRVVTWTAHQRVDKPQTSRFPSHEGAVTSENEDRESVASNSRAIRESVAPGSGTREHGPGSMDQGAKRTGKPAAPPPSKATRLPESWQPTPELVAFVKRECPDVDGRVQTENFRDFWLSKSRDAARIDWGRVYQKWMRDEQTKAARYRAGPRRTTATSDDRLASGLALAAEYASEDNPPRLGIAR